MIGVLVAANLVSAALDRTPLMFDSLGVYSAAEYFARGLTGDGPPAWDLYLQEGWKPWLPSRLAGAALALLRFVGRPDVTLVIEQGF
jgi:hypothetical protein